MNNKSEPATNDAQTIAWHSRCLLASVAVAAITFSGCAMCCGPYDYHYPTFGGIVQRADPVWGRVGSLYSDPGPFGGPSADYNLAEKEFTPAATDYDDAGDDLGPLDDEDSFDAIEPLDSGNGLDQSDEVLPPPSTERPSPDDSTSVRRTIRKQSRRAWPRWR